MKAKLTDTTFIIHYRRDSEDRFFNLLTVLEFLNTTTDFHEVLVINDDAKLDQEFKDLMNYYKQQGVKVKGKFYQNDGIYNRNICFKQLAEVAEAKILCFLDADVLIRPEFLQCAQDLILQGIHNHSYPFTGMCIDLAKTSLREKFLSDKNFDFNLLQDALPVENRVLNFKDNNFATYHTQSLGGCYFITKDAYDKMGGHDERFIGWGWEDYEFCRRSFDRGNDIGRVNHEDAICWHLHHEIRNDPTHIEDNKRLAGVVSR